MKSSATRTLRICVPANRDFTGTMALVDSKESVICGPFPVCARAGDQLAEERGNPSRTTTLPYGDTPLGTYRVVAFAPTGQGTRYRRDLFGAHGVIVMQAKSGDAALAEANGRFEILVHGGPLSADGRLRATSGGVRIADPDLQALAGHIGGPGGMICECVQSDPSDVSALVDGASGEETPDFAAGRSAWITPGSGRVIAPALVAHGEYSDLTSGDGPALVGAPPDTSQPPIQLSSDTVINPDGSTSGPSFSPSNIPTTKPDAGPADTTGDDFNGPSLSDPGAANVPIQPPEKPPVPTMKPGSGSGDPGEPREETHDLESKLTEEKSREGSNELTNDVPDGAP